MITESTWQDQRLIIAHDPVRAADETLAHDQKIAALEQVVRGRKLSDGGATARLYKEVSESGLAKIVQVDLKSNLFSYDLNTAALERARMMVGKLLLVTNVKDLRPKDVVKHYKSLADIERGFKALKSDIEIGPVYHRLPERIRAHMLSPLSGEHIHRVFSSIHVDLCWRCSTGDVLVCRTSKKI